MKKIFLVAAALLGMISCESENDAIMPQGVGDESSISLNKEIFSFKNWDEFRQRYLEFAKLDTEMLEMQTFFSPDRALGVDLSYALQGILNKDHQFKVAGKTIWFDDGKFYELDDTIDLDVQKSNRTALRQVGSVIAGPITLDSQGEASAGKSILDNNQREFRKQKYIENCGTGAVQGTSPRAFKYVHEIFAETITSGAPGFEVSQYAIHLRVKLEYNHKRRRWRLSGERREISISVSNSSVLRNRIGQPIRPHPSDINVGSVTFSSQCASHQSRLLNSINAAGPIAGANWDIRVNGVITEKMVGDVPANRWRDTINW
ncbi:hypothetical protein AWE51_04645 [Aquimarina aggregata]|uniref:Uncharacterized protein n=1 Tax=Aquimarina aggregata TaxID=1642818 RepID=A0A163A3V9_9FLAO|nr:hypothetical protein [Aquimarina aggregata]KZS40248.1 hypothetical protein AWE51_04645 [Aquimarina aggregata]